ncbi:hypothetical protein ACWKWC_14605 [Geodermatophilus nigrescens]
MRTRTAAAVTLLLAAGTLGTLTGTAAAAPPGNTTTGSADAFPLVGGAAVFLSAFDPDGEAAFVVPEVFAGRYECVTEERVPAAFSGLGAVSAAGTVTLTCSGFEVPDLTGTLTVDVAWRGRGPVTAQPPVPSECRLRVLERVADVTGSVTVDVPGLVGATAALDGVPGTIRSALSNCAAPR